MKRRNLIPSLMAASAAVTLSMFTLSCEDNDSDLENAAKEVSDDLGDAADDIGDEVEDATEEVSN